MHIIGRGTVVVGIRPPAAVSVEGFKQGGYVRGGFSPPSS